MSPELTQWIVPLIVIFGTLSPAVIIALMLYLHRVTRQDMRELHVEVRDLRDRIGQVETKLSERVGRIEGRLDELREFFFRSGGTVA